MQNIFAGYGFYLGWSFGLTAFLMLLEPVLIASQRRAILNRLRRLHRANNTN